MFLVGDIVLLEALHCKAQYVHLLYAKLDVQVWWLVCWYVGVAMQYGVAVQVM